MLKITMWIRTWIRALLRANQKAVETLAILSDWNETKLEAMVFVEPCGIRSVNRKQFPSEVRLSIVYK